MADTPYSGTAVRNAHFARRPPVPGVNVDHITPDPEPDPFNPQPVPPADQASTVWSHDMETAGPSNQPNLAQVPVSHWWEGQPAVQSGVEYPRAQQAMQNRMLADHSIVNVIPDSIRLYLHATEGQMNQFIVGRAPREAGINVPENAQWLMAGDNGYDATNQPNEVYSGDAANVGRYRLGVKTNIFGLYESPIGKFGQDAQLRAITGLFPALPGSTPLEFNASPRNPNSNNTTHWAPAPPTQAPSMFGLPSETVMTDYAVGTGGEFTSEFADRNGRFYG